MFLSMPRRYSQRGYWTPRPRPPVEMELDLDDLINPFNFLSTLVTPSYHPGFGGEVNRAQRKRKESEAKEDVETSLEPKRPRTFELKVNMEGFKSDELNVKLVDNSLSITASHEHKEDDGGFVSRTFSRKCIVPDDVNLDELACNFNAKDNTMVISAPWKKIPAPQEKVIPINLTGAVEQEKAKEADASPNSPIDSAENKSLEKESAGEKINETEPIVAA